jgi:hypothetical protein
MERWKEEDEGWKRELMGGRFIRTEADKERKERRKISVGGGGESLIWRGKREATATNDGWAAATSVPAPPCFDKFFRSFLSWRGCLLLPWLRPPNDPSICPEKFLIGLLLE